MPPNATIYLFLLIVMATCFGPYDHHLAILQKHNLRYMQCSHVVWDPKILTVVQNIYKMLKLYKINWLCSCLGFFCISN
jgi:hypothetical protein